MVAGCTHTSLLLTSVVCELTVWPPADLCCLWAHSLASCWPLSSARSQSGLLLTSVVCELTVWPPADLCHLWTHSVVCHVFTYSGKLPCMLNGKLNNRSVKSAEEALLSSLVCLHNYLIQSPLRLLSSHTETLILWLSPTPWGSTWE